MYKLIKITWAGAYYGDHAWYPVRGGVCLKAPSWITVGVKICLKISRSAVKLLFDEDEDADELLDEDFDEECFDDDKLEFVNDPSGASKENTTSWKEPTNSGSLRSAALHMSASSSGGFLNPDPSPKVPIHSLVWP